MAGLNIPFTIRLTLMLCDKRHTAGRPWIVLLLASLSGLLGVEGSLPLTAANLQGEVEVSPEATPEIRQIKPNQASAGGEATLEIEGRNFSRGVYVSFSNPTVRVVSTRRVSATQLETKVAIGRKATSGTVSLYVSNPAGSVAEAPFTIAGGAAPPPTPPAPPPPAAPTAEIQPSEFATPEVAGVEPPRVTRGSQVNVKVTGKNFAPGVKVSFSNPGIRVMETKAPKTTELTARLQIAPDAPTGMTSLFVVNPDDREVEVAFEVSEGTAARPAAPAVASAPAETTGSAAQRFEVMNLGEGINILQNPNKPKGALTFAAGKLKYEEGGQEVFSAARGDIKEIDVNTILGVNTGTFHIILNSGKTFNFVAASLRPADTQTIIDALRRVVH